jgi:hypothetical protein
MNPNPTRVASNMWNYVSETCASYILRGILLSGEYKSNPDFRYLVELGCPADMVKAIPPLLDVRKPFVTAELTSSEM